MSYMASVVGISGCGKSTTIPLVEGLLAQEGFTSASFHDRTSDPASSKIDELLHSENLSSLSRMYLIIAARRQIIDRQIIPSLVENDVTLTDRFYPCTVAYQSYGEGLDLKTVRHASIDGAHGALPDRIFLLDVSVDTALERMDNRGGPQHIFDDENAVFHERVRQGYLEQASADKNFVVVDGHAPVQEAASFITNIITHHDIRTTV